MSDIVTIRTTNDTGEDVIDITLEVEDGEIINMTGDDGAGHTWQVASIRFNLADSARNLELSRCCDARGCHDCSN